VLKAFLLSPRIPVETVRWTPVRSVIMILQPGAASSLVKSRTGSVEYSRESFDVRYAYEGMH
jgi:hypothetical protein